MGEEAVTTAIARYSGGDGVDQAAGWAGLAADERRRHAVQAAHTRDAEALWGLTAAWLTLHGEAGAGLSAHTRKAYRQGVGLLAASWQDENLLHPGRDAAALWLRRLEQRGLAPASVQVRLAAARVLYSALRWAGATDADPFRESRPARDSTPAWEKRAPYSPEELDALLRLATGRDLLLILLAGHAGLRVSECLALRWGDISLPRRELVVRRGKGGRRRTVPLSATLVAALRAQSPRPGTPDEEILPYRSDFPARARVKALAAAAEIPYRGIHALRHACGTRLVRETNGNLEAAARVLGHSSLETARIYAKWSDETVRSTLADW